MAPALRRCQAAVDVMPVVIASKQSLVNAGELSSVSPPSSAYSGENNISKSDVDLPPLIPIAKTPNMNMNNIDTNGSIHSHSGMSIVSAEQNRDPAPGNTTDTAPTNATTARTAAAANVESARALFERLLLRAEARGVDDQDNARVSRQERVRETHLQAFERAVVHEGLQIKYEFEVPTMDPEEIRENAARRKKKAAETAQVEAPTLAVPEPQPPAPAPQLDNDMLVTTEYEDEVAEAGFDISSTEKHPERDTRTQFDRKHKHRNAAAEALANIMLGARRDRLDDDGKKPRASKKREGLRSRKNQSATDSDAENNDNYSDTNHVDEDEDNPNGMLEAPMEATPVRVAKNKKNGNGTNLSNLRRSARNRAKNNEIEIDSDTTWKPASENGNGNSNGTRRSRRRKRGDEMEVDQPPRARRRMGPIVEDEEENSLGDDDEQDGNIEIETVAQPIERESGGVEETATVDSLQDNARTNNEEEER